MSIEGVYCYYNQSNENDLYKISGKDTKKRKITHPSEASSGQEKNMTASKQPS